MRDYHPLPWSEELWSITVPYDYDGYTQVGVNFGDGMADYWEDENFNWVNVTRTRPFVAPGLIRITDYDSIPAGRGIVGDNFCNFAEYRGLVTQDWDTLHHVWNSAHHRLDRHRKTVVVHVREDMDRETNLHMPGYIYALQGDSLEIVFTDSIRFAFDRVWAIDEPQISRFRRDSLGRRVDYNKEGASLWYYGFARPTAQPMPLNRPVRAVTFWRWDLNAELPDLNRSDTDPMSFFGITWPIYESFACSDQDSSKIPNGTRRCLVNLDSYHLERDQFYHDSLAAWQTYFPLAVRKTIAHEFGHTIGMCHSDSNVVVRDIMSPGSFDRLGHFLPFNPDYSDSSKAQISIKEPPR